MSKGECAHYWFTGLEEVRAEEEMMKLRKSSLRLLNMSLLHEAMSKVMGQLYGCRSTNAEVSKSGGRNWRCFYVIELLPCSRGKDMSGVKHAVALRPACTWCLTMMEGIWNPRCWKTGPCYR